MPVDIAKIKGLTSTQVLVSRKQHGENLLSYKKENSFLKIFIGIFKEPMAILLLVAIAIYLASGDFTNGIFLALAVFAISAISLYQDLEEQECTRKVEIILSAELQGD
ncbi:cation-transporting P-type ATPase [Pedobacter sp. SL55]|uniref:cation-transporting P-type ATPase n=1 Tax=Pedobacter sp. SL55 TaxID=2995161 RepID=UPI00226DFD6B|nr:cation-transporting P-type ATPase [Pedobacter sp. SL55]WAC39400.1 cation-transporting P-type ATPase [Pedobacter sp. SL55]